MNYKECILDALAAQILGERYRTPLTSGIVAGIRTRFDFVSPDDRLSVTRSTTRLWVARACRRPNLRRSPSTSGCWRRPARPKQFLVFGNDREVPLRWLERDGALAGSVQFFFLSDEGHLEVLQ